MSAHITFTDFLTSALHNNPQDTIQQYTSNESLDNSVSTLIQPSGQKVLSQWSCHILQSWFCHLLAEGPSLTAMLGHSSQPQTNTDYKTCICPLLIWRTLNNKTYPTQEIGFLHHKTGIPMSFSLGKNKTNISSFAPLQITEVSSRVKGVPESIFIELRASINQRLQQVKTVIKLSFINEIMRMFTRIMPS